MGRLANDVVARSTITISDGSHYEKRGNGKPVCIDDEIPFEIPESWEWARISSLSKRITKGTTPRGGNAAYQETGIGFLRAENVGEDGVVHLNSLKFISEDTYHAFARSIIEAGDILITIAGTLGRSAIVKEDQLPLNTNQAISIVRLVDKQIGPYLLAATKAPEINSALVMQQKITAIPNLTLEQISNCILPIPPLEEQKRIIVRIDNISSSIAQYGTLDDERGALDAALPEQLRKSILQQAVRGKLVSQDPNDEPALALLERIRKEKRQLIAEGKCKAPKGGESVIYRASDGGYYEKCGKAESVCIDDEIPFEIPESWEWVRLRSIGVIVGGGTPKTGYPEYWSDEDDGIPWITPADMKFIKGEYIRNGTRYISEVGLSKSSAQLLPFGSVLMSSRAPIGYLGIAEVPLATNQGFKSVVLTNVDINRWVLKSLEAIMPSIKKRASGTTFKEISGNEFSVTLIPLPPLSEQCRIVAMIDRIMPKLTNQ